MFRRPRKIEFLLSLVVIILIIIPAYYVQPQLDDYSWPYAFKHTNTFFENQQLWYTKVNGRILASLISTLLMSGYKYYVIYSLSVFAILVLFYTSLNHVLAKILNIGAIYGSFITSVLIFFMLLNLPQLSTFLYWLTGSIVYLISFILCTLFLLFSLNIYKKITLKKVLSIKYMIVYIALGVSAILFYELSFIFIFSIWGLFSLLLFKRKRINKFFFLSIFIFFIFFFINIYAPGSSIKTLEYSSIENKRNFYFFFFQIFSVAKDSINLTKVLSIFLMGLLVILYKLKYNLGSNFMAIKSYLILILILFNFLVPHFLYLVKIGTVIPDRAQNFIFAINSLLYILFILNLNPQKIKIRYINPFYYITILAFFGLCFLPNNARVLIGDIKHDRLQLYANQFKNRYKILKDRKKYHVTLDQLKNVPESIFYYDLEIDSTGMNYFYNEQLADFYLKAKINKSSKIYFHKK